MITAVVNGVEYSEFMSGAVTLSMESLANDYTLTASAAGGFPALRLHDAIQIKIDGTLMLSGHVEEVKGSESEGQHTVTYSGRDKTGDVIDSQLNTLSDLRAGNSLTLAKIIKLVLKDIGSSVGVIDSLRPAPFNTAEDIVTPKVGQSAYELIASYARKRQALLSSDAEGNIVVTQSSASDSGATVQRLAGRGDNNILSQSWSLVGSKLYRKYVHRGQLDPRALNFAGDTGTESVENQFGEYTDTAIRVGRQFVKAETENAYSSAQLKDRARWSGQLAKAQATRFSCTVAGHQMPEGGLWLPNTLVRVRSDAADIDRQMLLTSVTYSQSTGQVTTAALEFAEKDVYTINDRLLSQRKAGSQNDVFKSLG